MISDLNLDLVHATVRLPAMKIQNCIIINQQENKGINCLFRARQRVRLRLPKLIIQFRERVDVALGGASDRVDDDALSHFKLKIQIPVKLFEQ